MITKFLTTFGFGIFMVVGAFYSGDFQTPKYMVTCYNGDQIILKSDAVQNFNSTWTTYSFDYEGKHFIMPKEKCTLVK